MTDLGMKKVVVAIPTAVLPWRSSGEDATGMSMTWRGKWGWNWVCKGGAGKAVTRLVRCLTAAESLRSREYKGVQGSSSRQSSGLT